MLNLNALQGALAVSLLASAPAFADPLAADALAVPIIAQFPPVSLLRSGSCAGGGLAAPEGSGLREAAVRCGAVGPDLLPRQEGSLPAAIRLALHAEAWRVWNRLDTACQGSTASRCSLFSVAIGIHGASANLQWRVDGARALIPGHEFGHDPIHVRFQASYAFE